jgi:Ca2+-binding EF-hand superfamily protein
MKGLGIAPAFGDIDSDGDGKLTEAEFTAGQQAHRKAMREAHASKGYGPGHGMHKGMKMPTFEDLDLDGNGCISAEEFAKHQAEMHNR